MGQRVQIEWHESADELKRLYQQERHYWRRTRLHALWHLREGKRIQDEVEMVGVSYRASQNWLAWYRQGGLKAVLARTRGAGNRGAIPKLDARQQRALAAKVELGEFRTVWEAVQWVRQRWDIRYTYKGMYALLQRLESAPKVPRPQSEKADPQQQAAWKRGAW